MRLKVVEIYIKSISSFLRLPSEYLFILFFSCSSAFILLKQRHQDEGFPGKGKVHEEPLEKRKLSLLYSLSSRLFFFQDFQGHTSYPHTNSYKRTHTIASFQKVFYKKKKFSFSMAINGHFKIPRYSVSSLFLYPSTRTSQFKKKYFPLIFVYGIKLYSHEKTR